MRFLAPEGLLALLLAVPILLLYLLQLHRREVQVPSILLWQAVVAERHANQPWQKLRRNWLLILQLLVLLTSALALARPAIQAPLAVHGQVLVLLDTSASMQAQSQTHQLTRFELARHRVLALADAFSRDDRVTLITVGSEPRLLCQDADASDLRDALQTLVPSDGPADWRAAAMLAAGMASGEDVSTLLVTDSAIRDPLPALPGEVRLIQVAASTLGASDAGMANVGVVAFSLRYTAQGTTAFVRLYNAGPPTTRTVALYADGVLFDRRTVDVPELSDVSLSFSAVPADEWAEVRLEERDALSVDDAAWVALSKREGARIFLATSANRFLTQALRSLPGVELTQAKDLTAFTDDYGLVVLDGPITGTSSLSAQWLLAPVGETACGKAGEIFTQTGIAQGQWMHPLLRHVDWRDVSVARARRYDVPGDADVLIASEGGPLLWILDRPGQRTACLAFDLHNSDLPLRLAFPVLTSNLVGWLMPQVSSEPVTSYPAGFSWQPWLPIEATSAVVIAQGHRSELDGADAVVGEPRVWPLDGTPLPTDAGLYRVVYTIASGQSTRYAALSLLSEEETDLRSRTVHVQGLGVPVTDDGLAGWREYSPYLIAGGLILLLLEAVVWWRLPLGAVLHQCLGRLRRVSEDRTVDKNVAWHVSPLFIALRVILILLLILALFGFRWRRQTRDLAVVFLLDRSASTRATWDAQKAYVREALAQKSAQDRAAVVVFARDAWVDRPLSTAPTLDVISTAPRDTATDIEQALRLGMALIPEGAPGRLVLLSDGLETVGDALTALQEVRNRDIALQFVRIGSEAMGAEVWISGLRIPNQVYPGDRVPIEIKVGSNKAQNIYYTWSVAEQVGREMLPLVPGINTTAFTFMADAPGFVPLRVCVDAEVDTFVENNCSEGWVFISGSPNILLVGVDNAGSPSEITPLKAALDTAGFVTSVQLPNELPTLPQGLSGYAAVILVNTPARAFNPLALDAIQSYVRDLGGGLITVGGPQSYGVGGWLGTALEETLPVEMRVQDPRRFPPFAMVIVIDKSGSMAAEEEGTPKIRLAAEAGIRVAEGLQDRDVLAVVAFDDRPSDILGPVLGTQRDQMILRLRRLQAGGGGIYIREALEAAVTLLDSEDFDVDTQRYIFMLADGSDAEHQAGALELVAQAATESITVSTIAIGEGSDSGFLERLAMQGQGRFYLAQRAAELPLIFTEELAHIRRSYIVETDFYPIMAAPWEPVKDIIRVPMLRGYVAVTPKDTAQVVWTSMMSDPLLTVWQYGLGQALAWTSDATGRWAADWMTWDQFPSFWSDIVRAVLRPQMDTDLVLDVFPIDDQVHLSLDVGTDGTYVDGLDLAVQVMSSAVDAQAVEIPLTQTAPGRYEANFTPLDSKALLLRLYGDRNLTMGWAPPASPETIPGDANAAMAKMIAMSDGALVEDPAQTFVHDLRGYKLGRPLAPLLILLTVLLWPIDIAGRRLSWAFPDGGRFLKRLRIWLSELRELYGRRSSRKAQHAWVSDDSVLQHDLPLQDDGTVTRETLASRLNKRLGGKKH